MSYAQVIPLFMGSDENITKFFQKYHDDIDAITGTALVVLMPREVQESNAAGIASIFSPAAAGQSEKRFPGLLRSDLPCLWLEDATDAHAIIRLPDDLAEVKSYISAITDAISVGQERTANGIASWAKQKLESNLIEQSRLIRIIIRLVTGVLPVSSFTERLIAVIFGVVFVATILVLAVVYPNPTVFQYQVFRIVLAIAAAGFISMTPGFLELKISNWLRAGGALAVFVILFFYNPASLVIGH